MTIGLSRLRVKRGRVSTDLAQTVPHRCKWLSRNRPKGQLTQRNVGRGPRVQLVPRVPILASRCWPWIFVSLRHHMNAPIAAVPRSGVPRAEDLSSDFSCGWPWCGLTAAMTATRASGASNARRLRQRLAATRQRPDSFKQSSSHDRCVSLGRNHPRALTFYPSLAR